MTSRRRRLPLRHAVAALGVAAIGWVMVSVSREVEPDDAARAEGTRPPAPTVVPTPATAVSDGAAAGAPAPPPAPPIRAVSGPGIAPLPIHADPPTRIQPPPKPVPPPVPVAPRRLMPILMESTAEFSVGAIRVRLPGVAVIAADEICRDREGTEWPCGRRALAGVRALVRGRVVDCPLPEKVKRGSFVVDCTIAGTDLAERIVASGWARALDREGRLAEAERQAEAQGLGLAGPAIQPPVDLLPAPAVDLPPDTTTAPIGAVGGVVARPAGPETRGAAIR